MFNMQQINFVFLKLKIRKLKAREALRGHNVLLIISSLIFSSPSFFSVFFCVDPKKAGGQNLCNNAGGGVPLLYAESISLWFNQGSAMCLLSILNQ